MFQNVNTWTHWAPICEQAGVDIPQYLALHTTLDLLPLTRGEPAPGLQRFFREIEDACLQIGYPAYIRPGQIRQDRERQERDCVHSAEQIPRRIAEAVNEALEAGPPFPTMEWIVAERLPFEPSFYVGDRPVRLRRRYCVQDGKVVAHRTFWPEDKVRGGPVSDEDWREILARCNKELKIEVRTLTQLSERVARLIESAWCIDWLWASGRGWVCVGMTTREEMRRREGPCELCARSINPQGNRRCSRARCP